MSTTRPDNTPSKAAAIHTFTDDGTGKRPEFVPVDRNGNVVSGGGGGGGSGGDVTAPRVTGTLAQAVQGITGGVPLPVAMTNPTALTDAQLRASDVAVLTKAVNSDWTPGYGIDPGGNAALSIEPNGSLSARALCLTDEGSYRCNFANASTQVSIGSCAFTNGSKVVTGSFGAVDLHHGDYVRLGTDAENALAQVDSLTATGLVLVKPYTGTGGTGAAIRQILRTTTGTGATISVASGQCTLAAGTTANAITEVERDADFLPLAKRCAVSISQRIANQDIYIGLYDTANANPLYFAWFRFNGAVNTTVICESALNPTAPPSGGEIETTAVTIPNGQTTANLRRYQVELFADKARFFIDGVLVAEHARSLPRPSDVLGSTVRVVNGGAAPASNTNVVVDYDSCQNFNRLQVGGASDGERVVAESPPLTSFAGSAGVLNGNVVVIDCLQHRAILLQILGTFVGTASFQASNDPTFATTIAQPAIPSAGGAPVSSTTAVGHWVLPVVARYLRVRITAYTSGTVQAAAFAAQTPPVLPSMAVNGTVTATVAAATVAGGTVAEDAAAGTSPLLCGAVVRTAQAPATLVAGDVCRLTASSAGQLITKQFSPGDTDWQATGILTTTTAAALKALNATYRNYCTGLSYQNTSATATTILVQDGATTIAQFNAPANMATPAFVAFPTPLRGTINTAMNIVAGTTGANVLYNAQGYQAL